MQNLAQDLEPAVPAEEVEASQDTGAQVTEQKPEVETPPVVEEKKQTMVPHAALHEERQRRKALEQEMQRERQERAAKEAVQNDRLNQIYQLYQAQQQPAEPQFRDPNSDSDPVAAVIHNQQLTYQQLEQLRLERAQERAVNDARQRQEQRFQQLLGWAGQQEAEFKQEHQDFDEAFHYVRNRRRAELEAMGFAKELVERTLAQNQLWIIESAAQTGRNPAELVYNMARQTGFKGKQPDAEQKIETLQKGVAASKNLGNGTPGGKPTAEQLADMSDEEFAEFKASLKKQGKRISDAL